MHALRNVHRLLVPGGRLVDLHPVTEEQVVSDDRPIGTIEDYEWISEDLPNAEARLQEAIRDGLYVAEEEIEFDLLQHFDLVEELIDAKRDLLDPQSLLVQRIRAAGTPLVTRERYVGRRLRSC